MAINYNKLWKLLIDRGLIKKDLREMAGLSTNVIAKMGKNGVGRHCGNSPRPRIQERRISPVYRISIEISSLILKRISLIRTRAEQLIARGWCYGTVFRYT